jgi:hypothetical protein
MIYLLLRRFKFYRKWCGGLWVYYDDLGWVLVSVGIQILAKIKTSLDYAEMVKKQGYQVEDYRGGK